MEKTLIGEFIVPLIWDIMNLMSVWGEGEKPQLSSCCILSFILKIWACDLSILTKYSRYLKYYELKYLKTSRKVAGNREAWEVIWGYSG